VLALRTPYVSVCLQECDRMNILLNELRHSLKELKLGLKGDLTMSQAMEDLMAALYLDRVPGSWAKKAYPSLKGLPAWSDWSGAERRGAGGHNTKVLGCLGPRRW